MKYLILLLALVCTSLHSAPANNTVVKRSAEVKRELTNEEKIYITALKNGLDTVMAKILVAQALHESGSFNNNLTKKHNNVFAVMHSRQRCLTTSLGPLGKAEGRKGFASYSSIESATIDVLIFLYEHGDMKFKNVNDYSKWLKSIHYYEADQKLYCHALKMHLKKVSKKL